MYASYTKADTSLHEDDIEGVSSLYPSGDAPVDPPEEPSDPWCEGREGHPAYAKKCGG